jgi:hypothetical protein
MPESKTKVKTNKSAPATHQKQKEAPKFPSEMIDLPSKGLMYPKGHPLSTGTIEMKYMTAREEDILTSANLIKKGVVIDQLLKSMILSDVEYDDLYIGDKNAVMLSARVLGYGKDYECEVDCPECGDTEKDCNFDLTSFEYKPIEDESFYNRENIYDFILPNSERPIQFRYLTHKDEDAISREVSRLQKISKGVSPEMTTRLRYQIVSVEGDDSTETVANFVRNELFAADSRALREYMTEKMPDVDFESAYVCPSCGETSELELPISANFFWPSR